jgi:protein tyrosine/serine phosphatase/predicted nucleotidyltransferase
MLKLKQSKVINIINDIFRDSQQMNSAILIGSFAKNNPTHNSDIDYQVLVNNNFDKDILVNTIKLKFNNNFDYHIFLEDKNKLSLYMYECQIVVEIMIHLKLEEFNKYFLGDVLENIVNNIVMDKNNILLPYLENIKTENNIQIIKKKKEKLLYLITEFQSRFESLSREDSNSDGYKYSVLFSHALNSLIRIIYLCESDGRHEYMPKNFLTNYSYPLKLNIEELATMDLRKSNKHKRMLLDLFQQYLPFSIKKFTLDIDESNINKFLENIYKRDFFWNFRDMSKFNDKLQNNKIFRSTALCLIEDTELLEKELHNKNITTIIDLRAHRELEEVNYTDEFKNKFNVIHAPFDPWVQSIEFKNMHNTGSNIEIAYKFFSHECKQSMNKVITTVLDTDESIVIDCHAGKDRTGIIFTILHMLVNTKNENIYIDYLASKMDTKTEYIDIFINIVKETGGIIEYLKSCNLSGSQINNLKLKVGKV